MNYYIFCLWFTGMLRINNFKGNCCSVMSDYLRPHGLQHARLPCPLLSPRVCSNLFIESMMTSSHFILCRPPSPPAINLSQHQGLFRWVSSSQQVAKVLELQQSPSNKHSGLISFRTDLISLLSKGLSRVFSSTSLKASILQHSAFFMVQLTHPYMTDQLNNNCHWNYLSLKFLWIREKKCNI